MHQVVMRKPRPPLRWAGSKRKLLSELARAVPLEFSTYIEPFAGSACLFFHLQPKRAILGDINPELIGFYRATRKHPHEVLRSAIRRRRTAARVRYIAERDATSRASLFLFLKHFCFNGIFRTNSKGNFNVPFGTRTGAFPSFEEFHNAANLLKRVTLLCSDFEHVLHRAKEGDFAYLDPPYVYRTRKDRGEYAKGASSAVGRNVPVQQPGWVTASEPMFRHVVGQGGIGVKSTFIQVVSVRTCRRWMDCPTPQGRQNVE